MRPNRIYSISLSLGVLILTACANDSSNPQPSSTDLFSRSANAVYESPIGLAADPAVLMTGDTLLLYYTAEEGIAVVYSIDDGSSWQYPDSDNTKDYIALTKRADHWDQTLETADVIKVGSEYKMYYTGYREGEGDTKHIANYEIGLATSQDGFHFTRHLQSMNAAIVGRDISDENTYDRHAMTSPAVVYADDIYHMIYAGWNVANDWTGPNAGIRILGATSMDGVQWKKIDRPLLIPTDVTYSPDINEASLMRSEDGFWYIPFSTDKSIGLARSLDFAEGYTIYPEAIISPQYDWDSEVTAPDGFIDGDKMRLWYHGVKEPTYWPWVIGYAETDYPIDWQ